MEENSLSVRRGSGAAGVRSAVAACACVAVMVWIGPCGRFTLTARAAEPTMDVRDLGIADELRHLGALRFNTRLQDAADENVFDDLPVVVTISDVIADSHQCLISYRQHVEREEGSSDEQRSLTLADIDEVKVEPFESFENEHQGQAGRVYTMTYPQISAVVITHRGDMTNWFAVMGAEGANRLAEAIRRRGDYCRGHGGHASR